ncbi:Tryptophan/tyrosine permease family protein [uncultured archaeon]|nr:Tryptophan/tyrosine permease family protein [uncultured archaeon]
MKTPRAFFESIATLTGCIIGAGVLGIPYVVVRSGFWTGMLVLVVLGIATLFVHLLVGEISLRSNNNHQLAGYAGKYLGKPGKYLMSLSMLIGIYGAMIAYTLGVSESFQSIFGGSQLLWAVIFYILMALLVYGGLAILEKSELLMEAVKFFIFAIILVILFSSVHFSTGRFVGFSWDKLLLPYGVILFAYVGTAAIPEVREEMKKFKLLTKKVIIIGSLIPIAVYVLFTAAVIGLSGGFTTDVATIGLASTVGGIGFVLLHLFAILAMASSFIALGYALKDMFRFDFNLPHWESWALTMIVPVVLILLGVRSFIGALEIAGTFAGGIAGIAIVLMHLKARKHSERKPEYQVRMNWVGYGALILLFAIGMIYELFLLL